MGNLYTNEDKLTDGSSERSDWRVGSLDRFTHKIAWITDDHVTWKIRGSEVPKIQVRKFIEQCCTGDVYVVDDLESIICSTEKFALGPRRVIKWLLFNFEYEEDLAMFIMKFGESTLHPISKVIINPDQYAEKVMYKPFKYLDMVRKYNEKQFKA